MNMTYSWVELYIHCIKSGFNLDCMSKPRVCFPHACHINIIVLHLVEKNIEIFFVRQYLDYKCLSLLLTYMYSKMNFVLRKESRPTTRDEIEADDEGCKRINCSSIF